MPGRVVEGWRLGALGGREEEREGRRARRLESDRPRYTTT